MKGKNNLPVKIITLKDNRFKVKTPRDIPEVDKSLKEAYNKYRWEPRPLYRIDHINRNYPVYNNLQWLA